MSRIAIATFFCANNYGAYLQTFALNEWLKKQSERKIEILNYTPYYLQRPYTFKISENLRAKTSLKGKIAFLLYVLKECPYRWLRNKRFRRARKLFILTKKVHSERDKIDETYSAVILGSDQIWNYQLTHGIDKVYYGSNFSNNCIKISYAASLGLSKIDTEKRRDLQDLLVGIDIIGVREEQSVKLLNDLVDNTIYVNVDPTLLLSRQEWDNKCIRPRKNDYILVYNVSENPLILEDAKKISQATGLKVLHFFDHSTKWNNKSLKSISQCGPFEFVGYIASARIVLTNSFHATCFSIIYNKNFYVYLPNLRAERITSLARYGDFEDRLINYGESLYKTLDSKSIITKTCIDSYQKLKELRKESEHYLMNALSVVKDE